MSASGSAEPVDSLCKQHNRKVRLLMQEVESVSVHEVLCWYVYDLMLNASQCRCYLPGGLCAPALIQQQALTKSLSGAVTGPYTRKQYDMVLKQLLGLLSASISAHTPTTRLLAASQSAS